LENKITLVTGASRGIGTSIALRLGQLGAVVIGTATTESGANSINQYLEKAGIKGIGITLNVNNTEQIKRCDSNHSR